MTDLFTASTSKGKMTITESHVIIRLPGVAERSIPRNMITGVSTGLGYWIIIGFLRTLTIYAQGQPALTLGNLGKAKAHAAKALLGF